MKKFTAFFAKPPTKGGYSLNDNRWTLYVHPCIIQSVTVMFGLFTVCGKTYICHCHTCVRRVGYA